MLRRIRCYDYEAHLCRANMIEGSGQQCERKKEKRAVSVGYSKCEMEEGREIQVQR